jgi:hypothetical protein
MKAEQKELVKLRKRNRYITLQVQDLDETTFLVAAQVQTVLGSEHRLLIQKKSL